MRILMLAQFYPPIIGGEEHHVRSLSTALVARGHEVAVATIWQEGLSEYELDQGVRVYRMRGTMQRMQGLFSDPNRKQAPPFPDPELTLALRRITAIERPEIVHAHNWLVHSFLPLKHWSGARLIVTLHAHGRICAKQRLIHNDMPCSGPQFGKCMVCVGKHYGTIKGPLVLLANQIARTIERSAIDLYIAVSQSVAEKNDLLKDNLPFTVIPNFVPDDIDGLDDQPPKCVMQLPDQDFLLFVGAFGHYKGSDVLLEAYAGLQDPPPLVVIGYGRQGQAKLFPNRPPNVTILEDWPHQAVLWAWRRCMLGIIPSVWEEPFGIVALEAMAMGKPIIASRVGGLRDVIVHGETGLLVPPGNPIVLRQAITRLLAEPGFCRQLGQAALRRSSQFRATAVLPCIERVYENLLGERSAQCSPEVDPGINQ